MDLKSDDDVLELVEKSDGRMSSVPLLFWGKNLPTIKETN